MSSHSAFPAIKYPLEIDPPRLTPREFCRKMYGLSGLPEIEILRTEMEPGYRKRCIGLLSKTLGVKRQSVLNWGAGLEFQKMPLTYQRFLGMCWERYELLSEVKRLRRFTA
ncbi:hypothetical protein C7H19_14540 [Aphanothece hegewaldii CCALA 016]|uniref:Uncharacterized protein n=2 Tax=Aphanothece TaxID=1121 RepID=A0A2T1LVT6_9CHRO|nr:hypothetical protein C7H19_14540 [Aphanothece hegewaldii CCALA 016]